MLLVEGLSHGLLGIVGLWLLWSALRPGHDHPPQKGGVAFGVLAGLPPRPLTLFVMTYAMVHNVPSAGLTFAAMMILGVSAVLCTVATCAVLARAGLGVALRWIGPRLALLSRGLQALTGALFVGWAAQLFLGG